MISSFAQRSEVDFCLDIGVHFSVLNQLRTTKSKVYFILQLGYFKAKHLFFNFDLDQVSGDVAYVLHRYFSDEALDTVVDKQTRLRQQRLILQLFQYRRPTNKQRELLHIKAGQAARVCGKPVYVFRSILQYPLQYDPVIEPLDAQAW